MENQKPLYLYVKGNIEALSKSNIAIIGTRKPSNNTEIFENTYEDTLLNSVKHYFINQSYNSAEIGGSADTTYTKYYYDSLKRLEKEEEIFSKYPENNTICEYYYSIKNLLQKIKIYKVSDNSIQEEICYTYD